MNLLLRKNLDQDEDHTPLTDVYSYQTANLARFATEPDDQSIALRLYVCHFGLEYSILKRC